MHLENFSKKFSKIYCDLEKRSRWFLRDQISFVLIRSGCILKFVNFINQNRILHDPVQPSTIQMLVFLLTVLRAEEAGQCITEFSGTGHRIECITELIWNSKCLFFNSSFPITGHKTMCITELLRTGHCTEHF